MSYCSGDIEGSACKDTGLPMKSLKPARCWLSSSSSISTTVALATTRNSLGLNWRASRKISREERRILAERRHLREGRRGKGLRRYRNEIDRLEQHAHRAAKRFAPEHDLLIVHAGLLPAEIE